MNLQPTLQTFSELTAKRLFRIPNYQRPYSWTTKQRGDLFSDIRALALKPGTSHFMATMVGLQRAKTMIVTDEYEKVDVVDGQQRLTTLIILVKAILKALDRSITATDRLAADLQEWLVKQDDLSLVLLQTNHDTSEYFVNYIRHGSLPQTGAAATLAERELERAFIECEKFVSEWAENGKLVELVGLIKNRLTFIFHSLTDESIVYTVFEVLNSRGLTVAWTDRLKSTLLAVAFEFSDGNTAEVVGELQRLWGNIYSKVGLNRDIGKQAVQFAATLQSPIQTSKVLGEEAAVGIIRKIVGKDPAAAIKQTKFLLKVVSAVHSFFDTSDYAKAVMSISQARLLATAIVLRDVGAELEAKLLEEWERVSFRIFGLCRKDGRTKVGAYVRLARDIYEKIEPDAMSSAVRALGETGDVDVEWAIQHLSDSDCYASWDHEVRYLLFRYEEFLAQEAGIELSADQWNRIWTKSPTTSIEHIYPQSKGTETSLSRGIFVHRLGNLMLLPPGLNSKLQDKSPKEKAEAYRSTGLLMASEVVDLIETSGGWNRSKVIEREDRILKWAKAHWR